MHSWVTRRQLWASCVASEMRSLSPMPQRTKTSSPYVHSTSSRESSRPRAAVPASGSEHYRHFERHRFVEPAGQHETELDGVHLDSGAAFAGCIGAARWSAELELERLTGAIAKGLRER